MNTHIILLSPEEMAKRFPDGTTYAAVREENGDITEYRLEGSVQIIDAPENAEGWKTEFIEEAPASEPGAFRAARGCLKLDEPSEVAIRRLRDNW
jgi:hypothetical protein